MSEDREPYLIFAADFQPDVIVDSVCYQLLPTFVDNFTKRSEDGQCLRQIGRLVVEQHVAQARFGRCYLVEYQLIAVAIDLRRNPLMSYLLLPPHGFGPQISPGTEPCPL